MYTIYTNNFAVTSAGQYAARYRYYETPIDEIPLTQLFVTALLSRSSYLGQCRRHSECRARFRSYVAAGIRGQRIAQCIVVASCRGEINVKAVLRERQAIAEGGKKSKENKGTGKKWGDLLGKSWPITMVHSLLPSRYRRSSLVSASPARFNNLSSNGLAIDRRLAGV